jgi:hypothetical protein
MGFAGHFGWDLPVKLNGIARSFSVGLSIESLAKQYGFELQDCSKDYNHPRGQLMVELRKPLV